MENYEEFASLASILGGVPVWGAVRGSAADNAGLRGGDILLRVNGVPGSEVGNDLRRDSFGQLELQILRNGGLVRLHMPPETDDCVIHELRQQLFGRHRVDDA
jgi:C-terminal processing protease CtpA/Prc